MEINVCMYSQVSLCTKASILENSFHWRDQSVLEAHPIPGLKQEELMVTWDMSLCQEEVFLKHDGYMPRRQIEEAPRAQIWDSLNI